MIGGFNPDSWYWSSTEIDATGAWIMDFFHEWTATTTKAFPTNVRCIRKF
jgi:hypothetical protein